MRVKKMKKTALIAIISSLLAVGLHFYLAKRSYALQAGQANQASICYVNESINCDQALASSFSKIFGMSISNFGMIFNLFFALILLLLSFRLISSRYFWQTSLIGLSGFILLGSVVMMAISLVYQLICPFCWLTYLLSLIVFAACFVQYKQDFKFKIVFQNYKFSLSLIAGLLILPWMIHQSFVQAFDIKSLEEEAEIAWFDWTRDTQSSFTYEQALFKKTTPNSRIELVEFIDFLCPYCKKSHQEIKKFLKDRPDVNFYVYVFPLDKTCNPALDASYGGLSCRLASFFVCSIQQNKGEQVQNLIFQNQARFSKFLRNKKESNKLIEELALEARLNLPKLKTCQTSKQTKDKLLKSAKVGQKLGLLGTPTFFLNKKQVRSSHINYTLNYIYNNLD